MWIPLAIAAALSLSGRYQGATEQGVVWLDLRSGGAAAFGGVGYTWAADGDTLVLTREGETLRLQVEPAPDGFVLRGPPFGAVWLRAAPRPPEPAAPPPAPAAAAPAPPPAWLVGRWAHQASGGRLELVLQADGAYRMIQPAPAEETRGRWRADDAALTLEPDGGQPLRYPVRLIGGHLLVRGGDLPMEVAFDPVQQ